MDTEEVQGRLRHIGWPIVIDGVMGPQTEAAVRDFQRGFGFWNLAVDGIPGPKTAEAILKSQTPEGGQATAHFAFKEFASKGNGWIRLHRNLVRGLEAYRRLVGGPVYVISGYRDPDHNRRVGGASRSQHLYGSAADVRPRVPWKAVRDLHVFGGIGISSNGNARHVDVRPGSRSSPTTWRY